MKYISVFVLSFVLLTASGLAFADSDHIKLDKKFPKKVGGLMMEGLAYNEHHEVHISYVAERPSSKWWFKKNTIYIDGQDYDLDFQKVKFDKDSNTATVTFRYGRDRQKIELTFTEHDGTVKTIGDIAGWHFDVQQKVA